MYIKIQDLAKKHNVKIKGILHLGAHQAEEAPEYQKAGASKVIWIEGNPELIPILKTELKKYKNQFVYNVLVSDTDDQEVTFNITNNLQSSSILELGSHKKHHPNVMVHHTLTLKTHRLDTFLANNNVDISDCNFLNIDLQGAEMLAMKGLGKYLNQFDYIYTEINIGKVYKDCPILFEIDSYLQKHGFIRVETHLTRWQWGDGFYIKQSSTSLQKKLNLFNALFLQYTFPFKNIKIRIFNFYKKIETLIRRLFSKKISVGVSTDIETNGENYFLKNVLKNTTGRIVIFDVGANIGYYTEMVLNELSKQKITQYELHLFEPQESCFKILCDKFRGNDAVKLNQFALSDTQGEAVLHTDVSGSSLASLYDRKAVILDKNENIQLQTIDNYATKNKISKITLLKIDVEGNEKKVLTGCGKLLNPKYIETIQFEYGGTFFDANITLSEVVQLLINEQYFVGKILPNKIDYKDDLGSFLEDYKYSNYGATKIKYKS